MEGSGRVALEMEAEWEQDDRSYTGPQQCLTDPPGREHSLTLIVYSCYSSKASVKDY